LPANPKTPAQVEIRGFLSAAAVAFKSLDPEDVAAWDALAQQMERRNVLGINYRLTGIALFVMVNSYRQMDGQEISDSLPNIDDVPPPYTSVTEFKSNSSSSVQITLDATGVSNGCKALLRLTNSLARASRKLRVNELRLPYISDSDNFATASSGSISFNAGETDNVTVLPDQFCGFSITLMSPAYLPRAAQFTPQQLISA
jgi:hypothetical protein